MTDYQELRRLAEAAIADGWETNTSYGSAEGRPKGRYNLAVTPQTILALLSERDHYFKVIHGQTDRIAALEEGLRLLTGSSPAGHEFSPWRNDYKGFDQAAFDEAVRRGELHPTCSACSSKNNPLTTAAAHAKYENWQQARSLLSEADATTSVKAQPSLSERSDLSSSGGDK